MAYSTQIRMPCKFWQMNRFLVIASHWCAKNGSHSIWKLAHEYLYSLKIYIYISKVQNPPPNFIYTHTNIISIYPLTNWIFWCIYLMCCICECVCVSVPKTVCVLLFCWLAVKSQQCWKFIAQLLVFPLEKTLRWTTKCNVMVVSVHKRNQNKCKFNLKNQKKKKRNWKIKLHSKNERKKSTHTTQYCVSPI